MISADALRELAPTGVLRAGVVVSPGASVFFATKDGAGAPQGVTVDLLRALAGSLELPLALQVYFNSGQVTDAVAAGDCDVAFMPHDAERARKVDFGPSYYVIASTYLVPAGSAIRSIDEVNREGVRIVAIANTTTMRSARRTAPLATVEEVESVERMAAMVRAGDGDAFALTHDSFANLLPELPGARVLAGHFQQVGIGIAVTQGRKAAHALVTAWLSGAKASGVVRRALDAHGFPSEPVAP